MRQPTPCERAKDAECTCLIMDSTREGAPLAGPPGVANDKSALRLGVAAGAIQQRTPKHSPMLQSERGVRCRNTVVPASVAVYRDASAMAPGEGPASSLHIATSSQAPPGRGVNCLAIPLIAAEDSTT